MGNRKQPFGYRTIDVDAADRRHSRSVVLEDIAHVVEQPHGGEHDRRRMLLSTFYAIYEEAGVSMTILLRHCELFVGSVGIAVIGRMF